MSSLRVAAAEPEYLLAMKCMSMRIGEESHDVDTCFLWTISGSGVTTLSNSFRRRPFTLLKRSSRRARKTNPRPGDIERLRAWAVFGCALRFRDRGRSGSAWQEWQSECNSRCLWTGLSTATSRWRSSRCSFARCHELEPIAGPSDGPVSRQRKAGVIAAAGATGPGTASGSGRSEMAGGAP